MTDRATHAITTRTGAANGAISRRAFLAIGLAAMPGVALARGRVASVDVSVSGLVASRTRIDMAGRIRARIAGAGGGRGAPVRVIVELDTIDPYRAGRVNERRGVAARYRVVDAATGRTLKTDRFIERTTVRDDVEGTVATLLVPRTQAEGERELADEVARHVLRYGL